MQALINRPKIPPIFSGKLLGQEAPETKVTFTRVSNPKSPRPSTPSATMRKEQKIQARQTAALRYDFAMVTTTGVMEDALTLPRADRSYIANKLIESLDEEQSLSAEWQTEVNRRYARWQAGETQSIPSEEVHRRVEELIASR
jgi:putative addiction module component (TIGR02574 family)